MGEFSRAAAMGWDVFVHEARRYDLHYDLAHARRAWRIRANAARQGYRLAPQTVRQCRAYAREVLGSIRYAPWLEVYAAFYGRFAEGWIADNYYGRHVVRLLKGRYGKVASLRPLGPLLFATDAFPDIGAFVNGAFFDGDRRLRPDEAIARALFATGERIVFKADNSGKGHAVQVFTPADFDPARIRAIGSGVFQRWIDQHPDFAAVMPESLTTLRISTVLEPSGAIGVRAAHVKFGRRGERTILSETAISVPAAAPTGALAPLGFSGDWTRHDRHPDSDVRFEGLICPRFQDACALAMRLHATMPYAQSMGWDMAVDREERIWVLECNATHNGITYAQAENGAIYGGLGWETLWRQ